MRKHLINNWVDTPRGEEWREKFLSHDFLQVQVQMQNGYFLFWSVDDMNNDITDTWFKQCPKCITSLLWNIKNSFVVLHSERSLVPVIRKTVYHVKLNSPLVCLKVCKQTLRTETFAPGVNFSVDSSGSFEENRSCRCCCFCFFLPSLTLSGSYKLTWAVAAFGKTCTRSVMHKCKIMWDYSVHQHHTQNSKCWHIILFFSCLHYECIRI